MGWPTIADSVLLKNINSNPSLIKVAKTTDILDGADKLVRGPWWCRDLYPSYVSDFVWNPIVANMFVDLSGLTDVSWMNRFITTCVPTGFIPATAFPGGQPITLTYGVGAYYKYWLYECYHPTENRRLRIVCGRIESLAFPHVPPICYALGIFVETWTPLPDDYGCVWFGLKSGNTPRGEYVLMCTNSARPVEFNNYTGELRVYYQTGGWPPTHQLCPCNIEYTPQIFSFTVT